MVEAVVEDISVPRRTSSGRQMRPCRARRSSPRTLPRFRSAHRCRHGPAGQGHRHALLQSRAGLKLVEVIRGDETSNGRPVRSSPSPRSREGPRLDQRLPGFVSNRILMPFINEAVAGRSTGVARPEAIDTIAKLGFAHPMGRFALADAVGLDVRRDHGGAPRGARRRQVRAVPAAPRARRGRATRPEVRRGLLQLLVVHFELTDDQRQIQALTREFADAEIAPNAADWDREHRFPRDLYTGSSPSSG